MTSLTDFGTHRDILDTFETFDRSDEETLSGQKKTLSKTKTMTNTLREVVKKK